MEFAKRILNKYGWQEGDGLGKNNDGILKPLKASLKFDNAGLGADQAASDFNNRWWERVFNEAAQNVKVETGKNGAVCMDLNDRDNAVEISTKAYSVKKLKRAKASAATGRSDAQYDNFLQAATLTETGDEVANPFKIAVTDIAVTQFKTLTDEELFAACKGRTAHKGARHGLKLSGKLERLERQEQEMLAKMHAKLAEQPMQQESKKKAKREKIQEHDHEETSNKSKKSKRKAEQLNAAAEEETPRKLKKKTKKEVEVVGATLEQSEHATPEKATNAEPAQIKKSKRKKKTQL